MYHDLINRVVDYDINTDNYVDKMVYSAEGLMIGAFESLKVRGNIYGNTPITLKALEYVKLDEGIYDPNNMPEGITVEVGKITCGDDFTSQNTPYSRDECSSCSLDQQVGSFAAPQTRGKIQSYWIDMPTVEEWEELARSNPLTESVGENGKEVIVYPNPVTDIFMLAVEKELQEVLLLDQSGAVVKEFVSSERMYDIRELASGVYTLILKFTDNEIQYVKVVKL